MVEPECQSFNWIDLWKLKVIFNIGLGWNIGFLNEICALQPCKTWWNLSFDWVNWANLKVILNIGLGWFLSGATLSLTRVPVDCRGLHWSPKIKC